MANIPVEQKAGTPWWTWLLAVLAVIALIWLISALLDNDDDVVAVDDQEMVDTEPMDAEPMGMAAMVGQSVDLDEVRVDRVIGDRTFTISSTNGTLDAPSLVVLDEQPTTPSEPGIEGMVDVNPGQLVSIEGTVSELNEDPTQALGITQTEADEVNAQRYFIRATTVDILEADQSNVEVN